MKNPQVYVCVQNSNITAVYVNMGNNPIIEAWEDLDNGKYMPFDLA